MRLMIIGTAGAGKDTLASIVAEHHGNTHILHFADKLKSMSESMIRFIVEEELLPVDVNAVLSDPSSKLLLRPLWQWLGTDFVRNVVGQDYWVSSMEQQVLKIARENPDASIIIPDCRFHNECLWGRANGFTTVRVLGSWSHLIAGNSPIHESEQYTESLLADHVYQNSGSIEDMREWAIEYLLPRIVP